MKCQECHQNPASLHFTKIVNGKKTEMHLCEECASEKGEMFAGTSSFSLNNLLSGLLNFEYPVDDKPGPSYSEPVVQCDTCGLTNEQFLKTGKFGCADCYKTFRTKLEPILKRVHSGNTRHGGKIPKRIGGDLQIQKQINELKEEMQQCVLNEEFERAAQLRDEIRTLQQKREGED